MLRALLVMLSLGSASSLALQPLEAGGELAGRHGVGAEHLPSHGAQGAISLLQPTQASVPVAPMMRPMNPFFAPTPATYFWSPKSMPTDPASYLYWPYFLPFLWY